MDEKLATLRALRVQIQGVIQQLRDESSASAASARKEHQLESTRHYADGKSIGLIAAAIRLEVLLSVLPPDQEKP